MNCPVCKMEELTIADRQGIEIDFCPKCRGVWLDRGELDKIVERSAAFAPQGRSEHFERDRRGHFDDDDYGHGRKKKNFLSELFD